MSALQANFLARTVVKLSTLARVRGTDVILIDEEFVTTKHHIHQPYWVSGYPDDGIKAADGRPCQERNDLLTSDAVTGQVQMHACHDSDEPVVSRYFMGPHLHHAHDKQTMLEAW